MHTIHPRLPVRSLIAIVASILALPFAAAQAQTQERSNAPLRPPAVPLVTHDPYFSVWSTNDRLTHDWSRHWTGTTHPMCGMARVDGKAYRFMGLWRDTDPMEQKALAVTPTRTTYTFEAGGVQLALSFLSPLLPDDLDVLARPVTYLTMQTRSIDGKEHAVQLYFDATAEWAVNNPDQPVTWKREPVEGIEAMRVGTAEQPVLAKHGDNLRIDWGYFYVAAPKDEQGAGKLSTVIAADRDARGGFVSGGRLPDKDDEKMPRPARQDWPVLATSWDLGKVGKAVVSRRLLLAYDPEYAIQHMGKNLRPYWRRNGMDAPALLKAAAADHAKLVQRCNEFDRRITDDARTAGGEPYARLIALSHRQTLAAHGLVADEAGNPLHFSKENFSNGCIGTVDVIYPAAPLFLLLNPGLLKAQLIPVLDYAQSPKWKFPFAPHDLGTYPKANGQVYGGGERDERDQMPVEESGNMLIMMAALAKVDGDAKFAERYWPLMTKWAEYLRDKGMDPENQLCTDDFAGHLAHNANLSLKAIVALGGYAQLCEQLGKTDEAKQYRTLAEGMARKWQEMAADGDHYVLAFGSPGTWSQKYNLVWDKLLGLNLFPDEIDAKESAFYMTRLNRYGLPLDNRKGYTKLDWEIWTAVLMPKREQRDALLAAIDRFVNETPSRVPLTDWYQTADAKQSGFQARSVVGGVYILLMDDAKVWKKWASAAPVVAFQQQPAQQRSQSARPAGRLMTRWAKDVSPDKVHPEYPRPQMVRKDWLNLNGLWDYAITAKEAKFEKSDGQILVPFPVESALSGVMKQVGPDNRLWYRRTFSVPKQWGAKRVLLHFGAVDWDTTVTVNGKEVGKHRGGYDPFSFDVTDALKKDAAEQQLIVSVWDPSDASYQPRGKQIRNPHGIWYTPTTGIWQTVWLEPVSAPSHVQSLVIVPDIDNGGVFVTANVPGAAPGLEVHVMVFGTDGVAVNGGKGNPGQRIGVNIPNPKLWSPDSPALYDVQVSLLDPKTQQAGQPPLDHVRSYFGMRKVSLGKDENGITRILLNNRFLFQYGPLDQGFWPDGLYTAPTDEALKYDIEVTKRLGFNMARKHVKVEPARWYYHCDKLGLLVWQDMPSGDRYISGNQPDIKRTPESDENFVREWKAIIDANRNSPSIIMWVPFNEGWGQYDTKRILDMTKEYDPTRLVDAPSGWTDRGVGDTLDLHIYPGPTPNRAQREAIEEAKRQGRAIVLGEFGGLGLPVEGHTWLNRGNWGYRSFTDPKALTEAYVGLLKRLHPHIGAPTGYSAAVYTQTTDVEVEVNGLMTYDRAVIKMDEKAITEAAKKLYEPPPPPLEFRPVVADSRDEPQTWSYTTDKPADGWEKPSFDASSWKTGPGGFGTQGTPGTTVRTQWNTPEIWARREFDLPEGAAAMKEPHLTVHHDEDAEIYLNGVLAVRLSGYTSAYEEVPLSPDARAALKPGRNMIAVHVKQTGGGQYIDVGIAEAK